MTTITTAQAATTAGVTIATIRHWCRYGAIAAVKHAGRWIITTASLARRIAIGAMRAKAQEATVTETYPWDDDHPEAEDLTRLVQAGISTEKIVAALGSDAQGMGRYRPFNGRARRWVDAQLSRAEALAEQAAEQARAAARATLATDRQIDYILDLQAQRRRTGDGGGFMSGLPTTREGLAKLSRSEASSAISSLREDY